MNRNPVQQYETARGMTIPALVAVMNGQSDMVDLTVAHSVLRDKMEAEIAKKGAMAQQMPQQKIRDRDIAMASGLGGAPADVNVPMGGIVGNDGAMSQTAAGGGSVVAFQSGGYGVYRQPTATPTFGGMVSQQAKQAPGFMDRLRQGIGAAGRFLTGRGSMMGPSLLMTPSETNAGEQEYLDLIKKLQAMGYSADMIAAMSPEQRMAAAQGQLPTGPADTGGTPTQSLAQMEAAQAAPTAKPPPEDKTTTPGGISNVGGKPTTPGGGIADIAASKPMDYANIMKNAEEFLKANTDVKADDGGKKTLQQFTKDEMDALREAGYDFNIVRDQITKLAEEKEELAGDKKEAQNLRLIEAGLGILGGESPHAFVNIGKGATPALQGLAKDLKEIKKNRRELDKEALQLKLLQNQITEGTVKNARARLDKQEERYDRRLEQENKLKFDVFRTMASDATQRYVAETQRQTSLDVANIGASKVGETMQIIQNMPGETFGEKVGNYFKSAKGDAAEKARITALYEVATDPVKMRQIERTDKALHAQLKALLQSGLASAGMITEKPDTGPIRK